MKMKNYNQNEGLSYPVCSNKNNLHGWTMMQELLLDWFE